MEEESGINPWRYGAIRKVGGKEQQEGKHVADWGRTGAREGTGAQQGQREGRGEQR